MIDLLRKEELRMPNVAGFVQGLIELQGKPLPGSRRQLALYTKNISDVAGLEIPLTLEASVGGPGDVYYRLRLNAGSHGFVLGSQHYGRTSEFTRSLPLHFLVEALNCTNTVEDFFAIYHFFCDPEMLKMQ